MLKTILVLSALIAFSNVAAASPKWSSNAGSCVPDSTTASSGQYSNSGGIVQFSSGTGTLNMICPVTNVASFSTFSNLYVYGDKPTSQTVAAVFYKMDLSTGSITSVASTGCSTTTGTNCAGSISLGGISNDPTNYSYFVHLYIVKTGSTGPRAYAVSVD